MNEKSAGGEAVAAASPERTITLNSPVKFGEETITKLTYREPTGADIKSAGHPVKVNFAVDPPDFSFDEAKMERMMSLLYGHPPSVIARLSANDWTTCAWAIAGFFTPDLSKI